MSDRILKGIQLSAFYVSVISIVVLMLIASAGTINLAMLVFILWAISPYICVLLFDVIIGRIAPKLKLNLVICITSVLMAGFTLYVYIDASQSKSSTAGLVFIFAPLYLHISWIIILGSGLVWTLLPDSSEDINFKDF